MDWKVPGTGKSRRTQMSNIFFFFNDTATTEIYTLSLHDALPICRRVAPFLPAVQIDPNGVTEDAERSEVRGPAHVQHRQGIGELGDVLEDRRGLADRSEEHTSELQSQSNLVCRLPLEKKNSIRKDGRGESVEMMEAMKKIFETIATAKIATSAHEALAFGFLSDSDRITMNRDRVLSDA